MKLENMNLEKTEKTFSAVGFDIKNIIEIMKMEQL